MVSAGHLLGLTPAAVTRNEALLVLAHLLGVRKETLIAHPEYDVDDAIQTQYKAALQRISEGFPTTYLLGKQAFWGRDFVVTPDVLIPRPDTETLVECALEFAKHFNHPRILDLGTGSGAIAITLALEIAQATICATDISPAALAVARQNAINHQTNVRFIVSDWFEALSEERFDIIVSNPPYIHPRDEHLLSLRFEPQLALTDGVDGLTCLRRIVTEATQHLEAEGVLLLEHGFDQGNTVRAMFASTPFVDVHTVKDLGGNDRVTCATIRSNKL